MLSSQTTKAMVQATGCLVVVQARRCSGVVVRRGRVCVVVETKDGY